MVERIKFKSVFNYSWLWCNPCYSANIYLKTAWKLDIDHAVTKHHTRIQAKNTSFARNLVNSMNLTLSIECENGAETFPCIGYAVPNNKNCITTVSLMRWSTRNTWYVLPYIFAHHNKLRTRSWVWSAYMLWFIHFRSFLLHWRTHQNDMAPITPDRPFRVMGLTIPSS